VTTHDVLIKDGGFGSVIMNAMARLQEKGAPGGATVKGGGGKVEQPGATEKGQSELQAASEKAVKAQEGVKGFMGRLGKTLGIQVGLSSILKQSQIFTGTIGSIFQIFGALVDVILAPFLPIIVPAIRMLASFIPMIYAYTSKIGAWIQENLTVDKIDSVIDTQVGKMIDFFLGWLPEWITKPLKETLLGVNWGTIVKNVALGAILLVFARKFGFFKLLAPIGRMLLRIPFLGALFKTLWTKLAGLGGVLAKALIPGFGKIMGKNVTATGKEIAKKTAKGTPLQTAKQIREGKKSGGMFGKLKGLGKSLKPGNMLKAAKTAGPMGLLKGVGKKIVPGLSSAFLMYEGIKGAIDVYKSNRAAGGSFWKSLGKAGAVAGVATAAAGLSFVPGMGLVAPIAGSIATGMMRDKMMINVNVDGQQVAAHEVEKYKEQQYRNPDTGSDMPQVEIHSGVNG